MSELEPNTKINYALGGLFGCVVPFVLSLADDASSNVPCMKIFGNVFAWGGLQLDYPGLARPMFLECTAFSTNSTHSSTTFRFEPCAAMEKKTSYADSLQPAFVCPATLTVQHSPGGTHIFSSESLRCPATLKCDNILAVYQFLKGTHVASAIAKKNWKELLQSQAVYSHREKAGAGEYYHPYYSPPIQSSYGDDDDGMDWAPSTHDAVIRPSVSTITKPSSRTTKLETDHMKRSHYAARVRVDDENTSYPHHKPFRYGPSMSAAATIPTTITTRYDGRAYQQHQKLLQ